jgi:cytochrome P450
MSQSSSQYASRTNLKTPPGPPGHFLLGHLPEIRRGPLQFLERLAREYGDIARFRFLNNEGYLLNHPDFIRHVLVENNRNYNKQSFDYQILKPIVGNGLLTSDGDFWLRQRRLIQPSFHKQRIKNFGNIMVESTLEMLERWNLSDQRELDISFEMTRLTLTIVGRALFSKDIGQEADVVGEAFSYANEYITNRTRTPLALPISWPTPANQRFRKAKKDLEAVVLEMIAERRSTKNRIERPPDLLDMLLQARDERSGEGMTDSQLQDEVMTLMLAGHETTANALTWTWYLLSQNPSAEDRLHEELEVVLAGRSPSIDDISSLPYTSMVVQEAIRLYPPAWIIGRKVVSDDEIGGYHIPAGSTVEMSPYLMHRHTSFWKHPKRFDPERFTPEASEKRPAFSYFPFGGGPRLCIGRDFALLEARLILAGVASKYRLALSPGHPIELDPLITLRPKHGMKMRLIPKKKITS